MEPNNMDVQQRDADQAPEAENAPSTDDFYAAGAAPEENVPGPSGKKKGIAIGIVALVIAAIAACFFLFGNKKTPLQKIEAGIEQTAKSGAQRMKDFFGVDFGKISMAQEKKGVDQALSLNVPGASLGASEDVQLLMKLQALPDVSRFMLSFAAKMPGLDQSIQLYQENNTLLVDAPGIFDRIISLDLANLGEQLIQSKLGAKMSEDEKTELRSLKLDLKKMSETLANYKQEQSERMKPVVEKLKTSMVITPVSGRKLTIGSSEKSVESFDVLVPREELAQLFEALQAEYKTLSGSANSGADETGAAQPMNELAKQIRAMEEDLLFEVDLYNGALCGLRTTVRADGADQVRVELSFTGEKYPTDHIELKLKPLFNPSGQEIVLAADTVYASDKNVVTVSVEYENTTAAMLFSAQPADKTWELSLDPSMQIPASLSGAYGVEDNGERAWVEARKLSAMGVSLDMTLNYQWGALQTDIAAPQGSVVSLTDLTEQDWETIITNFTSAFSSVQ
ncbi:MAG: hypothetical protein SOR89_02710 [Ndongobacter sp.]|nr:hypothetical protein [Ndongobacter sp.]